MRNFVCDRAVLGNKKTTQHKEKQLINNFLGCIFRVNFFNKVKKFFQSVFFTLIVFSFATKQKT